MPATVRTVPAVTYTIPPTIRGVTSHAACGVGPKFCAFHRHTTCRFFTLDALIRSNGEYRVLPVSPPFTRHSPLADVPYWARAGSPTRSRAQRVRRAPNPLILDTDMGCVLWLIICHLRRNLGESRCAGGA